ncbi:MAG: hypothetical protein ABSG83_01425 [Roseiarcus sp.]|jgi:hypothetical protein
MRALAIVFGSILVFAGACLLAPIALLIATGDGLPNSFVLLWLVCHGISLGGLIMIIKALPEPRPVQERGPARPVAGVSGPEATPCDRGPGGDDQR